MTLELILPQHVALNGQIMRRKDLAKVSMKQCGTTSFIQTSLPYGRPSQLNSSTN